ncbi:uncharacterized protein LOC116617928 [Nematostella vectensis]|uniref:uncharacterized protein LOC116617928 n=1 Tax=Nematostella vectensis TaxID=45351 RepID=UPI00138FD94C|nr:uncharacterized protein LOC116617928 [Nematostella vectensis]
MRVWQYISSTESCLILLLISVVYGGKHWKERIPIQNTTQNKNITGIGGLRNGYGATSDKLGKWNFTVAQSALNNKTLNFTKREFGSNGPAVTITTPPKKACINECNTFVGSWSQFYLKIGGWLMLGIVLCGVMALGVTHYLGMRKAKRGNAPRRRNVHLSQIIWAEARSRSRLARWV